MPNYSLSRLERCYLQMQPVFGTIPNTAGTATVGNANACRFMKMELQNESALLERPDKTGTRSAEGMTGGRRTGRWTLEMSLHANGTPGVAPDCEPLLYGIFGQTAAVAAAGGGIISSSTDSTPIVLSVPNSIPSGALEMVTITGHTINTNANGTYLAYSGGAGSLTLIGSFGNGNGAGSGGAMSQSKRTYTFTDEVTMFTLWSFRTAASLDQRVGHTCTVAEATFNINQDVATWSASGDNMWVLRSKDFGIADYYQAGGLTTFPTEPSAPITNGGIIPGFTGRFVAGKAVNQSTPLDFATNAQHFPTIRNATIRVQTQNLHVRDTFGSYYSTLTEGDVRNITLTFNVYDDDSFQVNQLKTFGDNKTPVDFIINLGTVPGNTWVFYMKNVYLASHVLGDGQLRMDASYGDSRATTSNLAVRDEFQMMIC